MKEETWKKNQKTRNSKLDVKSPWLQQHIEGCKEDSTKNHWFDHGKETLEEDGPREEERR
jgi:hypothetical protein